MITTEDFKIVTCDDCGSYIGDEEDSPLTFPSLALAEEFLLDRDWKITKEGLCYCMECHPNHKETGVDLISKERLEQITKHLRIIEDDKILNVNGQLREAARYIISFDKEKDDNLIHNFNIPSGWDEEIWIKICNKSYKERLIIAGALIAAEYDRIN